MTGVHFLKANPESRRAAARLESMQIDNPGNSQGLRKMLQKICLKEVALDGAAFTRRKLANDTK